MKSMPRIDLNAWLIELLFRIWIRIRILYVFFPRVFSDFLMVPASRLQIAIPLIYQGPTAKVAAPEGSKTVSPRTDDKHCSPRYRQALFRAGPVIKTIHSNSFNLCFTPDRTQKETSKSCQPLFHAGPSAERDIETAPTFVSPRADGKKHVTSANVWDLHWKTFKELIWAPNWSNCCSVYGFE